MEFISGPFIYGSVKNMDNMPGVYKVRMDRRISLMLFGEKQEGKNEYRKKPVFHAVNFYKRY
jgi:hypothetical protein